MKNPFYILDVFAEEKYSGNQLAVVRSAASIPDDEMLQIAQEINFSETAFVLSDEESDGGYDVRIFTPKEEVPFAGHPVLGAAYVIQQEIIREPVDSLLLNLKIGKISVSLNYQDDKQDVLHMKQIQPLFGCRLTRDEVSAVLGIMPEDISDDTPVQEVSTGFPFFVVPLKSIKALKGCSINLKRYAELIRDREAKAILVFSDETYEDNNDLTVRVFADYFGIPEDPATGSANGCLGAYLLKHNYFGSSKVSVRVEQGYEMGRRSLLYVDAEEKDGSFDISVGGKVIMVSRGELA